MPDLVFATRGQAEAIAAQEAQAKKSREVREEFEKGAKATETWDANTAKLVRTSEGALRSIRTEQEKIAEKIALINERQEKGIGSAEENQEAIKRLQEQWVALDDATIRQKEAIDSVAQEHAKLKTTAQSALRSVQTEEEAVAEELENIEEQIKAVEAAMEKGLIPPAEAEAGIKRLKERIEELKVSTNEVADESGKLGGIISKAFDPTNLAKMAVGFVGIKGAIGVIKADIADVQDRIDKIYERAKKGFDEAVAAGDTARADKLRGIADRARGLESAAQGTAEAAAPGSPWMSREEQNLIDEVLRNTGQSYGQRTVDSLMERFGHFDTGFGRTREQGIQNLEQQLQTLEAQVNAWGGNQPGSPTFGSFTEEREQIAVLRELLDVLRGNRSPTQDAAIAAEVKSGAAETKQVLEQILSAIRESGVLVGVE